MKLVRLFFWSPVSGFTHAGSDEAGGWVAFGSGFLAGAATFAFLCKFDVTIQDLPSFRNQDQKFN